MVIYQTGSCTLDEAWTETGFHPVSEFDWAKFEDEFNWDRAYAGAGPQWRLFKHPPVLRSKNLKEEGKEVA